MNNKQKTPLLEHWGLLFRKVWLTSPKLIKTLVLCQESFFSYIQKDPSFKTNVTAQKPPWSTIRLSIIIIKKISHFREYPHISHNGCTGQLCRSSPGHCYQYNELSHNLSFEHLNTHPIIDQNIEKLKSYIS